MQKILITNSHVIWIEEKFEFDDFHTYFSDHSDCSLGTLAIAMPLLLARMQMNHLPALGHSKNRIDWPKLKVTLLSAPVSSELPFCKTTLLRNQLISPILFGLSKSGEKDVVLAIERCINRNVSDKAGFANYSSKLFVDFRKVDLSLKLLEQFLVFFRYIFSSVVDPQLCQV